MRHLLYKFDDRYIELVRGWPKSLRLPMKIISMSGSPTVTVGIGLALAAIGFQYANVLLMTYGGVICGIVGVSSLLKLILRRTRPSTYKVQKWFLATWSFPSGHSSGATIAYGTLALIVGRFVQAPLSGIVIFLLIAWIIFVGLSRVYLGAHYPSDVVAGWTVGAIGVGILAINSSLY